MREGPGRSVPASPCPKIVGRGLTNREIADQLYLSEATVKSHVAHILSKTGCRDRVQLVILAYDAGMIRAGG